MNYLKSLEYIHGTLKFGIKCGLDNIKVLLSFMGNPQEKLKFVHVAGTNGKGSTSSYINNILICAGYKTGLYTSPFLETFNERIQINNILISNEDISTLTTFTSEKIKDMVQAGYSHPTEFEIVTAMGFKYFADNNCDIVVLEVGLGGRLDATNIIKSPEVCVITTISFDHMNILGDSLAKIAFEKAGIIKEDTTVVLYPQEIEAKDIILDICASKNASYKPVDKYELILENYTQDYQQFRYKDYSSLKINLLGDYQTLNAATAIETILVLASKGYHITTQNIYDGLSSTFWPGRFEVLSKNPLFIIDGAHNVEGAQALSTTMELHYLNYKKIIILGLLRDKDINNIIPIISEMADHIITVTPFSDRALDCLELVSMIKKSFPTLPVESAKDLAQAVDFAKSIALSWNNKNSQSLICACGSLYYIGELRKLF